MTLWEASRSNNDFTSSWNTHHRVLRHQFYSIQWNHPSLQFFPKIVHAVLHICVVNVFLTVMWTLLCRKMKEWDQNDLGKGAKINLPVIQQSVKGKALPEAASCPLLVPPNSSCSRKALRKMLGWPVHQNPTESSGRKGIEPLASSSTFHVFTHGPFIN